MIFINFSLLYSEHKQLVLLGTISFCDDYPKVFFPKAFEEEALSLDALCVSFVMFTHPQNSMYL